MFISFIKNLYHVTYVGLKNVHVHGEEMQLTEFPALYQLKDIIKRYERDSASNLQLIKDGSQSSTSNDLLDSSEAKIDHYPIKIGTRQGLLLHKDDNRKLSMRGPPALLWPNIRVLANPGEQY